MAECTLTEVDLNFLLTFGLRSCRPTTCNSEHSGSKEC